MISVIIPLYNGASVIQRAVQSVLQQSYQDFEIIVVDDGSKDDSLSVVNAIQDSRVKVFHIDNHGASYARNYGMNKAQGERICFLDCDDEYLPGYLECLASQSDDLVICDLVHEGEKTFHSYDESFSCNQEMYGERLEEFIQKGILNSPVTKLYQRSILEEFKIQFPIDMKVGEDLNFNLQYLMHTKSFSFISKKLYLYHMDEKTGSHRAYLEHVIEQRRTNIDLLESYFKKYQITSNLISQLKVKLIYIAVMQELEAKHTKKQIEEMIMIPYFEEIQSVQGKSYQLMLSVYQTKNIHLICMLARMLLLARKHVKSASV